MNNSIAYRGVSIHPRPDNKWSFTVQGFSGLWHDKVVATVDEAVAFIDGKLGDKPQPEPIEVTRISSDVNGNPRRVVHFLALNTPSELANSDLSLTAKYHAAVKRANRIGGRRYHNKQYGGGIVFQSYNDNELVDHIRAIVAKDENKQRRVTGEAERRAA